MESVVLITYYKERELTILPSSDAVLKPCSYYSLFISSAEYRCLSCFILYRLFRNATHASIIRALIPWTDYRHCPGTFVTKLFCF